MTRNTAIAILEKVRNELYLNRSWRLVLLVLALLSWFLIHAIWVYYPAMAGTSIAVVSKICAYNPSNDDITFDVFRSSAHRMDVPLTGLFQLQQS